MHIWQYTITLFDPSAQIRDIIYRCLSYAVKSGSIPDTTNAPPPRAQLGVTQKQSKKIKK